jgi:hypothetical protein
MAIGDQTNNLVRLKAALPGGWFKSNGDESGISPTPILDAALSGFAGLAAWAYALLQYVKLQTRIATATDGWLDIVSLDFFGGSLPRLAGETDGAFRARIKANLFLPANTRAALLNAVETVTGFPARIIEPWQPNDTFVWGRSFWGVNTAAHPGQWANGNQRCQALFACALPLPGGLGGNPRFGWGNWFYGSNPALAVASGAWWTQSGAQNAGAQLVYAVINRVRPVGVSIFVKFLPPAQLP